MIVVLRIIMKALSLALILIVLCCLVFVTPGSAAKSGNPQGLWVSTYSATGTNAFLASYTSAKPVVTVWQPAILVSTPAHQTLVSENQLLSSYASLISSGSVISYPGGMAATMGGGGCGGS
jgi:hypothetical protein